ncbi:hypothetical protein AJ80_03975 [Polytolypa hystricis UAMH7299]|uniref:Protein-tyrosine phosphatase n=1 Tax=Polytolypa hystricis (strain UAMH7299) TaxID=1447883 RepID=A0A2B7YDJ2_POLH7|nr:hypothetical protein AJ80_03975 [Polytolypa hystricis UAMH7299]
MPGLSLWWLPCEPFLSVVAAHSSGKKPVPANLAPSSVSDGSHSCPDFSSLNLASQEHTATTTNLQTPASCSSPAAETASLHGGYRRKQSTTKRASSKVRQLLIHARHIRHIAATKMSESHLSSTLAKRGRSTDSKESGEVVAVEDSDAEGKENDNMPAFLKQSYADIRRKFEELEWIQRGRISAAILSQDASHKFAVESGPDVKARNRYMNVQAWANSRIHLKVLEGQCDFINASPIVLKVSSTEEEVRFIACQGPKDGHLDDFWNMIFHETGDVAVVVMLTQTFEGNKEKCAQYFPIDMEAPTFDIASQESDPFVENDEPQGADKKPGIKIKLLESTYDEPCRSDIRKLELTIGSESKTVWHFLFAGWSDYAKPEGADREALLKLTKLTSEKAGSLSNPRVVHCSAGVGRTGTFIALDHLLRELQSGHLVQSAEDTADTIFDTVNQLREQRMMMVYNDIQYQFIYDVLKEQWEIQLHGETADESATNKRASSSPDSRSQKMARVSSDDFRPTPKEELEVIDDDKSTPMRSRSGTPQIPDTEDPEP